MLELSFILSLGINFRSMTEMQCVRRLLNTRVAIDCCTYSPSHRNDLVWTATKQLCTIGICYSLL